MNTLHGLARDVPDEDVEAARSFHRHLSVLAGRIGASGSIRRLTARALSRSSGPRMSFALRPEPRWLGISPSPCGGMVGVEHMGGLYGATWGA